MKAFLLHRLATTTAALTLSAGMALAQTDDVPELSVALAVDDAGSARRGGRAFAAGRARDPAALGATAQAGPDRGLRPDRPGWRRAATPRGGCPSGCRWCAAFRRG